MSLNKRIEEFLLERGAIKVRFANTMRILSTLMNRQMPKSYSETVFCTSLPTELVEQ